MRIRYLSMAILAAVFAAACGEVESDDDDESGAATERSESSEPASDESDD
jgi:hypothetical protein